MDLSDIRKQIDVLDDQLEKLISERAKLAQAVGELKKETDPDGGFYRPERESQVLQKIIDQNLGPLSDETMRHIFREIMSACLSLESQIKVAYLGPVGTYTQLAAEKHFGSFVKTEPFLSIADVFREVELSDFSYGVVPVENSSEGAVSNTLDEFINSSVKICGEIELPIHHNLISKCDEASQIKRVYAHNQSLMQCSRWLDINLNSALQIPVSSNAEAAKMAQTAKDSAAIAGEIAARVYNHNIIARNIENTRRNTTRFLVIGNQDTEPCGQDKTSLLLSTSNKPGALHDLLQPFAKNGVSLTKIESRPSQKDNWHYVFFVDVIGHQKDETVRNVLDELESYNQLISILGSYPVAS